MQEKNNPHPNRERISIEEQALVFQGLLALIETRTGVGFHNTDPGHAIYTLDYNSETAKSEPFLTHPPEQDVLFGLLKRLSRSMREYGYDETNWYRKVDSWNDFQNIIAELCINQDDSPV